MKNGLKWQRSELGQTAVLFALMIVGLVAFVGLAVDGGLALRERRVTQNAADASALGGLQYIAVADAPQEENLLMRINEVIESNGVPDTNGVPGDAINANVVAYYTDDRGARLVAPNCSVVGTCGTGGGMGIPPNAASGIEVEIVNPVDTYLLGIVGQSRLDIAGDAVAVMRGFVSDALADNVMIALGQCGTYDRQMTGRGNDNEFLGGLHSNSYFDATGRDNHFHGQVSYVSFDLARYGTNNEFDPALPIEEDPVSDPFAGWSYTDFAPGSDIALANAANYWDVSTFDANNDGTVAMAEIINHTNAAYPRLYNPHDRNVQYGLNPNQMRPGIYYAGSKEIRIGETAGGGSSQGTNGNVTIVSGNRIKTTEKAMNLTAFMGQGSAFPGLLFFSDYQIQADPCVFDTSIDPVINMAGNDNGVRMEVYHHPDDIPRGANPDDYIDCPYPRINGCYVPSSAIFTGLIYAPHGRVDTADSDTTYIGAIIGYTIDYSGYDNLFVHNPALFPTSNPMIQLER